MTDELDLDGLADDLYEAGVNAVEEWRKGEDEHHRQCPSCTVYVALAAGLEELSRAVHRADDKAERRSPLGEARSVNVDGLLDTLAARLRDSL